MEVAGANSRPNGGFLSASSSRFCACALGSAENGGPENTGPEFAGPEYGGPFCRALKCRTGKCRTGFWRTILQEQWHCLQWSCVAPWNTASLTRLYTDDHDAIYETTDFRYLIVISFRRWRTFLTSDSMSTIKCSSRLNAFSRCFSKHNWIICSFCASGKRVFCFIIWATAVFQFPPALFLVLLFPVLHFQSTRALKKSPKHRKNAFRCRIVLPLL